MLRRFTVLATVWVFLSAAALAQSGVNDLLEGKLVDPKVGQWAWYDLSDGKSGKKYVIRQAIVDSERVGRQTGYWVEFEIVPEVGYRSVFKMLVTGPASDPKNVHRIIRKQGADAPEEVPATEMNPAAPAGGKPKRESLGSEDIVTPNGVVRAQKTQVERDGKVFELWSNEDVPPTGIVRMRSTEGDMRLRSYGLGGKDAESVLITAGTAEPKIRVDTKTEADGKSLPANGKKGAPDSTKKKN
jgi:hypothetical protein